MTTSLRSQKSSSQARWSAASFTAPASSARAKVRSQRSASSSGGTPRETWYVTYLTMRSDCPAAILAVTTVLPTSADADVAVRYSQVASTSWCIATASVMPLFVQR